MNGDDLFDPEVEFEAAVKALGEVEGHTGELAEAKRDDAKAMLMAVIAHQLGAIARYYERCEEQILNPIRTRDFVDPDSEGVVGY